MLLTSDPSPQPEFLYLSFGIWICYSSCHRQVLAKYEVNEVRRISVCYVLWPAHLGKKIASQDTLLLLQRLCLMNVDGRGV